MQAALETNTVSLATNFPSTSPCPAALCPPGARGLERGAAGRLPAPPLLQAAPDRHPPHCPRPHWGRVQPLPGGTEVGTRIQLGFWRLPCSLPFRLSFSLSLSLSLRLSFSLLFSLSWGCSCGLLCCFCLSWCYCPASTNESSTACPSVVAMTSHWLQGELLLKTVFAGTVRSRPGVSWTSVWSSSEPGGQDRERLMREHWGKVITR